MQDKLTLKIERSGNWFVGSCPEVPGANGQGRTVMSCTRNLVQSIAVLTDEEHAPVITNVQVQRAGDQRSYKVEMIESIEGVSVSCPDLPGCFSQGDDAEEALENIRGAMNDYLEAAADIKKKGRKFVKVA